MFLTIQHDSAVVVYPKFAEEEDSPIRLLQGDRTMLADPHGIAVDTKNQLMFVSNYGAVSRRDPNQQNQELGREKPRASELAAGTLQRSARLRAELAPLNQCLSLESVRRHTSVESHSRPQDTNELAGSHLSGPGARGVVRGQRHGELHHRVRFDGRRDMAPKRVLQGPNTMIKNPTGVFVDLKNDELWVANFGNHAATVYKRDASGDTAPLRVIRSGPLGEQALGIGIRNPVAYDTKREEILVPN